MLHLISWSPGCSKRRLVDIQRLHTSMCTLGHVLPPLPDGLTQSKPHYLRQRQMKRIVFVGPGCRFIGGNFFLLLLLPRVNNQGGHLAKLLWLVISESHWLSLCILTIALFACVAVILECNETAVHCCLLKKFRQADIEEDCMTKQRWTICSFIKPPVPSETFPALLIPPFSVPI